MTTFLTLIAILQSFSISLGVGASTLAITTFFVAIADGSISPDERKMMGVVYIILRIAMVLILLTTTVVLIGHYGLGGLTHMSAFNFTQILTVTVLFVNAVLMTLHLIPSNFGPAIQAGNWYTLGTLSALLPLGITGFSFGQFALAYIAWLILAISIVNAIMAIQMARRHKFVK